MNWVSVGAIGEIIGATAVVVSLVYLSIQVRTHNRESRIASVHEIGAAFREAYEKFTRPEIAELVMKGNEDYDALTDAEKLTLISIWTIVFRVSEEAFIQHEEGRLDNRNWQAFERWISTFMSVPCVKRIWPVRKSFFDDQFQRYVDNLNTSDWELG